MPVAVALLVRVIVQAVVQTGIFFAIEALLAPLIDGAKKAVKSTFNMTDEEAEDSIANEIIDALAMVGIIGASIKTKLPTIVAERLGFTSRGFVKRKISTKLPASAQGTTGAISATKVVGADVIAKQAQVIATKRGVSLATVQAVLSSIIALVGVPVGIGLLITNTIDFGAWNSSAYQQSFQKFLSLFGLEPDKDSRSPRTTSQDTFNKIYAGLQLQGATTINDPYKNTYVAFSRDNLLDLTDKLASQILVENGEVKTKTLLASVLPFIAFQNKPETSTTTTAKVTQAVSVTVPKVQVFTGVISQGVLGNGVQFQARTNDMIDDMAELVESASVNLANFLTALPSKVSYEIKIVSSVTDKNGFTQRGTTTKVISRYNANGTPVYKNITNKFAVLYLYLITDKGTRTKLTTINVGPVNSVNFQVTVNDLNTVASHLQSVVTTQDVSNITTITTPSNIGVQAPVVSAPAVVQPVTPIVQQPNVSSAPVVTAQPKVRYFKSTYGTAFEDIYGTVIPSASNIEIGLEEYNRIITANKAGSYPVTTATPVQQPSTQITPTISPAPATTAPPAQRKGANASTLSEWYTANGQSLPTIEQRSSLYQQYGLGSSALYVGSAEQNTRLLDKLKGF